MSRAPRSVRRATQRGHCGPHRTAHRVTGRGRRAAERALLGTPPLTLPFGAMAHRAGRPDGPHCSHEPGAARVAAELSHASACGVDDAVVVPARMLGAPSTRRSEPRLSRETTACAKCPHSWWIAVRWPRAARRVRPPRPPTPAVSNAARADRRHRPPTQANPRAPCFPGRCACTRRSLKRSRCAVVWKSARDHRWPVRVSAPALAHGR